MPDGLSGNSLITTISAKMGGAATPPPPRTSMNTSDLNIEM